MSAAAEAIRAELASLDVTVAGATAERDRANGEVKAAIARRSGIDEELSEYRTRNRQLHAALDALGEE